jgi:hypothetical protein
MKKSFTLLALCALLGSSPAFAAGAADMPYGSAGCGVGSLIFGSGEGFTQVLASFTNIYFGQIFSITSGTSNCTPHAGSKTASLFLRDFITANNVAFAEDVSRGQGETVEVIANTLGCSDVAGFGASLQTQYNTIYPTHSVSGAVASENIVGLIRSGAIGANCSVKI